MSLIGSLVDLGLGDILQIVSLSRKSGLLLIHSDEGEGRIVFCDGLVQAAYVKGEPEDLRGLLVSSGGVSSEEFDRVEELANERGVPANQIIPECTSLTPERVESLLREHVERAVFRIFSWSGGEFSFEVGEQIDARDRGILVPEGINAQFLTIEATRLADEGERRGEEPETPVDASPSPVVNEDPMFSGESESADAPVRDAPAHSDESGTASATPQPVDDPCEPEPDAAVPQLREVLAWREKGQDRLDYVLLTMDPAGGLAIAESDCDQLVGRCPGPRDEGPDRITMTLPFLNAARFVAVLVTGESMADAVRRLAGGTPARREMPAAGLAPISGEIKWYLDRPACAGASGGA